MQRASVTAVGVGTEPMSGGSAVVGVDRLKAEMCHVADEGWRQGAEYVVYRVLALAVMFACVALAVGELAPLAGNLGVVEGRWLPRVLNAFGVWSGMPTVSGRINPSDSASGAAAGSGAQEQTQLLRDLMDALVSMREEVAGERAARAARRRELVQELARDSERASARESERARERERDGERERERV